MKKLLCLSAVVSCIAASSALAVPRASTTWNVHGSTSTNVSRTTAKRIWSNLYTESRGITTFKMPWAWNTATGGKNPRIEAFGTQRFVYEKKSRSVDRWQRPYHFYWQGRFKILQTGSAACLFQLKTPNNGKWAHHLTLMSNGDVQHQFWGGRYQSLGLTNMKGKSFTYKTSSTGTHYSVWINGVRKINNEPIPSSVGNTSTEYQWRWGLYTSHTTPGHNVQVSGVRWTHNNN